MSTSTGSTNSDDQLSGSYSPPTSLAHSEEVQWAESHLGAEAQNRSEVSANKDIQPNLDYARRLRSIFMAAEKMILQSNFDIPWLVRPHFSNADSCAILDPSFGDV
jgi:hypothetical protein